MKLAKLILTVTVGSSTILMDGDHYLAIVPVTCASDVVGSTPTACSPPAVTTGPYTLRVSTSPTSDCYSVKGISPNGSLIGEQWTKCP